MEDLIEALTICLKYTKTRHPTNCSHDILFLNVDPDKVSDEDKKKLAELSFVETEGGFNSWRFGSC